MAMNRRRLAGYLLPGSAEQDPLFRQQLLAVSHAGLRAVGAIALVLAAIWRAPVSAAIAAGIVLLSFAPWTRAHARHISLLGVIAWSLPMPSDLAVSLLVLSTGAVAGMQPLPLLALAVIAIGRFELLVAVFLSAVLAAIIYAERLAAYRAHQQEMESAEILSTAPLRALLSENAKAVSKLSAALTHELNSPLGALRSSVDTLLVLAGKPASTPAEQQRLLPIQADLRRSIKQSADRLQEIVSRLQLFVDLETTERQVTNVNELLSNVAIVLEDQICGNVNLEFDLQPTAPILCRPQQLSTVFLSLLSNAIKATNGNGRIRISTEQKSAVVQVKFQDFGRGMSAKDLETVFDPSFKVSGDRVSTGNWSLFNSRQIVFEHGGEIQIDSAEGRGTTVCVVLPSGIGL